MQLFVIDCSFQNNEDQPFATNEFCKHLSKGNLNETDEFELKFIAHTPQNKSGVIICKAHHTSVLFKILKFWRESFNLSFNIKPALTNEVLLSSHNEQDFWSKQ